MEFLAGNRVRGLNSERESRSSYTTETVYTQGSGAGWTGAVPLSGAGNTRTGIRVEAGSSAIGKVVRKVTGKLSKSNSPTGTYKWTIRNNADTIVAETPTGNSSLLATAASVTETEFTFDVSRTLVEGDRIQVEFSGGDASNDINLSYNNGLPSMPSGFKRCLYGGSYSDTTTGTPYLIVDSTPASYTITTNALPNIEDGSIFYETDTNKSYVLYNGSWTEV
mgnify:FL=1